MFSCIIHFLSTTHFARLGFRAQRSNLQGHSFGYPHRLAENLLQKEDLNPDLEREIQHLRHFLNLANHHH